MLTQFAMPDRVQGLDIKMQRQGKIIKLQGNSLRLQWWKVAAQRQVDVRANVLAIKGAGTKNEGFADGGMSAEHAPNASVKRRATPLIWKKPRPSFPRLPTNPAPPTLPATPLSVVSTPPSFAPMTSAASSTATSARTSSIRSAAHWAPRPPRSTASDWWWAAMAACPRPACAKP